MFYYLCCTKYYIYNTHVYIPMFLCNNHYLYVLTHKYLKIILLLMSYENVLKNSARTMGRIIHIPIKIHMNLRQRCCSSRGDLDRRR